MTDYFSTTSIIGEGMYRYQKYKDTATALRERKGMLEAILHEDDPLSKIRPEINKLQVELAILQAKLADNIDPAVKREYDLIVERHAQYIEIAQAITRSNPDIRNGMKKEMKRLENRARQCEEYAKTHVEQLRETTGVRGVIGGRDAIRFFTNRDDAIQYMKNNAFDEFEARAFIPYGEQMPQRMALEKCTSQTPTRY